MKNLRSLVFAGTVAIGAALSAGAASAAPASALELGTSTLTETESSIAPAYYGYHHHRRLCHVPFYKLVQWFGFWEARHIKHRCHRHFYYPDYYSY